VDLNVLELALHSVIIYAAVMNKTDNHPPTRGPLFRPLHNALPQIRVELDGKPAWAHGGETVAALLLRISKPESYRRSAVSGAARAPMCMMGVCFDCLVQVDGQTNQQGCMIAVRDGMRIRRQNGVQV
jgi:D-hydroxyproline dehydrogenase subunit gamma